MNPATRRSVSWLRSSLPRGRVPGGLGAMAAVLSLCLAVLLAVLLAGPAQAQQLVPVPPLTGRVVDLTQTLDAGQQAELSAQLEALEKSKGSQLVVLVVPSTQPEDIAQYSIRVAEAWKIGRGTVPGKAGQRIDDGVILLVAKNDRKLRIEVGYGLEGAIPDAIAKRIITDSIAPRFKTGDYFGGIKAGVADLTRLIQGEALPAPAPVWQHGQDSAETDPLGWLGPLFFVVVLGFILRAILGRFLGSAAAGGAGWFTASMLGAPGVLAVVAGVGIFLFLLIFAGSAGGMVPQGRRSYRSGPVFLPGGFGGGGSGGGGGGFGGGGGGGFGGGGASGDW